MAIRCLGDAKNEARRLRREAAEAQLFLVTEGGRPKRRMEAAERVRDLLARAAELEAFDPFKDL